jgi:hypothetical protein
MHLTTLEYRGRDTTREKILSLAPVDAANPRPIACMSTKQDSV